jgi:hypothetical protein
MITVEIGFLEDGTISEEVEIYFDNEGLDYLCYRLGHMKNGKTDHLHLMSESWGMDDLSETTHQPRNRTAHHLRITLIEKP